MPSPFASQIIAANQALLIDGNHDAIETFFSPDYLAHVTGHDVTGGHDTVRKYLQLLNLKRVVRRRSAVDGEASQEEGVRS
ncbi:Unannotated [Lentimonas sp. CC19]|nr:Unannotated [Lentimonas sp. CC19]